MAKNHGKKVESNIGRTMREQTSMHMIRMNCVLVLKRKISCIGIICSRNYSFSPNSKK